MMFTRPQQQPYLIQMPPRSNRRLSNVSSNNVIGTYSMFKPMNAEQPNREKMSGFVYPTYPQSVNQHVNAKIANDKEINILTGNNQENKGVKPMKWGEPTWFLFHTLAEKVKEEEFSKFRVELLKTIYLICTALPCPECAKHASDYMNSINFDGIRTKEDLKLMLYTFHNVVNGRKKFELFKREDLDEKYKKTNTVKIIQNFMMSFSPAKNRTLSIDVNKHYRQVITNQLVDWFNKNITKFDE